MFFFFCRQEALAEQSPWKSHICLVLWLIGYFIKGYTECDLYRIMVQFSFWYTIDKGYTKSHQVADTSVKEASLNPKRVFLFRNYTTNISLKYFYYELRTNLAFISANSYNDRKTKCIIKIH